ncbi:MAG: VWA domain-containing protein [Terriglobales bacterium]
MIVGIYRRSPLENLIMRVFSPLTLIAILCFSCLPAAAQVDPCAGLPTSIPHANALRGVCEYSMSVLEKMPNFVCDQAASRYRGKSHAPTDLISSSVRYEDGKESYSDVKVNGRPVTTEVAQTTGLWSTGEFGSSNLRSIFDNQAQFDFVRESTLGEHSAWVFTYQIVQQKLPLWRLRVENEGAVAPPYTGELWIDQKTGEVLRFRSIAKDIPKSFPVTGAELQIDYESVAFADGSSFLLPADFTATASYQGGGAGRNVVHLRNCHKFGAKARIVTNAEMGTAGTDSAAEIPPTLASLRKDLDESEAIFAAIGEQALQENEIRREAEQKQMLDAVTASTRERLSALRSEQEKIQAQLKAAAGTTTTPAPAISNPEGLITLRISVKLVPVSVVLRDAKGHAVGNFGKENFRLFDEGRPQVITHFSVEPAVHDIPAEGVQATAPVGSPGAVQPEVTNRSHPAAPERNTAYLFDDVHSSFGDLASAREAARRHLGSLQAGERAAVFTTSGAVVVDFTADREALLAGLRSLKPHPTIPESDCPPISLYMADLMVNKNDPDADRVAVAEVQECASREVPLPGGLAERLAEAKAAEVLHAGSVESKNALAILSSVIRRTGTMPGQRTIVLISPGFLALTPDMHEDVMEIVDGAVRSGIIINTLDPAGLETAGFSGSGSDLGKLQFHGAEAQARSEVMFDFASGTGGVFFRNNNNLDEGFRRTADVPEFVYVLGFSPQKLDGKFHKLKVTLISATKFELQTRRGYYAVKPPTAE